MVCLSKNGKVKNKQLHRLVAETFISNKENKPEVNHVDGNKQNNDISNLEWTTRKENMEHAKNHELIVYSGNQSPNHKISTKIANEIRNLYSNNKISQARLAKEFNVNQSVISRIVNKKSWV